MRARTVVGNWKMHGELASNAKLLGRLRERLADAPCRVGVCVPFPYLAQARDLLDGCPIGWGAQDASAHPRGAYTGEVSAAMVAEFGSRWVIVGHSERRALFGDTDATVGRKAAAAAAAGLVPIVCVGETLAEREAGQTLAVVERQLAAVLAGAGPALMAGGVMAYEPVWAIGTGRTASPDQADEVHRAIRGFLARHDATMGGHVRILYGGSVKAANAAELFARPDIDGGLIGGASLDPSEFLAICAAAA
jgi:triosephosphate isomerase